MIMRGNEAIMTMEREQVRTTTPPQPRAGRGVSTTDEVPGAFDAAAHRYDLLVALNPGYHAHLRAAATVLADAVASRPDPVRVVDLGCGSGASTRALLSRLTSHDVLLTGVDASAGMLAHALRKRWRRGVSFVTGRAEDLGANRDAWGLGDGVDGVFAAYLFRNVSERDQVLGDVFDLLQPGGTLVVQEYSVAGRRLAALVWSLVCWLAVIPLAWLTTRDTTLYRYLWRSVVDFDDVEGFMARMQRAGFTDVAVRTVPGWQRGILHTFVGRRP